MVKQNKTTLHSSTGTRSAVRTPRWDSYYRLLLDDAGGLPRKAMLPDSVGGRFQELLVSLANLQDTPEAYIKFWGRQNWWSDVFLKEAAKHHKEFYKLRDQLRALWRPYVLPADTGINYRVQPLEIRTQQGIRVLSKEESKRILDKAESRLEVERQLGRDSQWIPASRRRLFLIYKAAEMGELKLKEGQTPELWEDCIVVRETSMQARFWMPAQTALTEWVDSITRPPLFLWRQGRILPDPYNLRAMLALAVADNAERFAKCRNPECPAPYFLANRKTQKYCKRGGCTAYAQRKHSLGWWNRVGKHRRKQK